MRVSTAARRSVLRCVVAGVASLLAPLAWGRAAAVALDYKPLDDVTYSAIQRLRANSGLDADALALANLTSGQAEVLLASLRSWHEAHFVELTALEENRGNARAALRTGLLQAARGVEAASSADLQVALGTADAAYSALVESCRTAVIGSLSEAQITVLDQARGKGHLPTGIRLMSLNGEQLDGVRAWYARAQLQPAAKVDPGPPTDSAMDLSVVVGAQNTAILSTVFAYVGDAAARIAAATDAVLPAPSESTN